MKNPRTILACLLVLAVGCGGDSGSPTSPSPPPQTPVITGSVTGTITSAAGGSVAGAQVRIGDGPNNGRTAASHGDGRYELRDLTPSGFTLHVTAAEFLGASRGVTVTGTSPNVTANFSLMPERPWTRTGSGANVFDVPSYFSRIRIVATYGGSCENFIVWIGGRLLVNEILGRCFVGIGSRYEGVHVNPGGLVEVKNSIGVTWALTEER